LPEKPINLTTETRPVRVGSFDNVAAVTLGGNSPVAIQTMWKSPLTPDDLTGAAGQATIARIDGLWKLGCRLLRFAAPTKEDAETIGRLAGLVRMPLVADIHFDYTIALRCLDFPIAKIRVNPGNLGGDAKFAAVLEKAAAKGRPVRVGVNAGSLPADLRGLADRTGALVEAGSREAAFCQREGFDNLVVSMKASSVSETIAANRGFAALKTGVPLHVGVTEAGPLIAGTVRNTAALLALLKDGIGSTVRVSLSAEMEDEVIAAREILAEAADERGEKARGVRLVSCPRCARATFDTHAFTARHLRDFYSLEKDACIAVMGCAVNGPGEARDADLGITGAGSRVLIFKKGKVVRTVNPLDAEAAFAKEIAML
jgi:(E)-4-hydroxy-3-methylbut-2-enyl-diphosphate synthase